MHRRSTNPTRRCQRDCHAESPGNRWPSLPEGWTDPWGYSSVGSFLGKDISYGSRKESLRANSTRGCEQEKAESRRPHAKSACGRRRPDTEAEEAKMAGGIARYIEFQGSARRER